MVLIGSGMVYILVVSDKFSVVVDVPGYYA